MKQVARQALICLLLGLTLPAVAERFELSDDETIVVVGNTFAERLALSGYFDALVHSAFPDHKIAIRHVPNSADEVGLRPRERNVPPAEFYLQRHSADVIVMCFGMSESFKGRAGLGAFEQDLIEQIEAYQQKLYNGSAAPRLILVSPIKHEDLGPPLITGDVLHARNEILGDYTDVMMKVANQRGVYFVDLFNTQAPNERRKTPLTSNGIAPTEAGCFYYAEQIGRQLGWLEGETAEDAANLGEALRTIAYDKHYHFRLRYRATNTEYVWGRRHEPYGVVNFPPELDQLDRMTTVREQAIWAMDKPSPNQLFHAPPTGPAIWESTPTSNDFPEDNDWQLPDILPKGKENSVGDLAIADPQEMAKTFRLPDGYKISCFASEADFEELANPLAMTFDYKGRLWVMCSPTYPHLLPGEQPDCKLLILEDTDADGKADKQTVFASQLNIPTGFAIDTDCVYVGQAPDLWKLSDTDGDDIADRKEIVYSGFGMPDSHHTISAFAWDPNGGILMLEGVFTKTNIETPYGTRRTRDAAVWRFDPRTQRIIAVAHTGHPNPWGQTFDAFGQSIMMDTSSPRHYNFSGLISAYEYPSKPAKPAPMLNRGRPTAGNEILHSRHFPDDAQGTHLSNQCIGFHGTRWDRLLEDGAAQSGYKSEPMPSNLVENSDTNFRPVSIETGPDGTLYIADWSNPLIGHAQYNVRDPRRDNTHGRIWRVQYTGGEILDDIDLTTRTIAELFATLQVPETNTRQRARRLLQKQDPKIVVQATKDWLFALNPRDPDYDRLALEAVWILQGVGVVDPLVLDEVMRGRDARARAGGVRALRYALEFEQITPAEAKPFIAQAVNDRDMRVRLEAVHACAFLDTPDAVDLAKMVSNQAMDDAVRIGLEQTLDVLKTKGFTSQAGVDDAYLLEADEFTRLARQEMTPARAQAAIARPEIALALRREALASLAKDPADQARILVRATENHLFDPARTAKSISPLLLSLPDGGLNAIHKEMTGLLEHDHPDMRSLAMAVVVRAGATLGPLAELDPVALIIGLSLLPAAQVSEATAAQLLPLVEAGGIDPAAALAQAVRLSDAPGARFEQLGRWIDDAREISYDKWDRRHVFAMAALSAMHTLPAERWPEGFEAYRLAHASAEQFELGREIYHESETGCAKCHGTNGEGQEGFPPLAGSPWVLGNPTRAAATVKHGLTGELAHTVNPENGEPYNAQMEPLTYLDTDVKVAAVLSYVRQSWGNFAAPVTPDQAAAAPAPPNDTMTMWRADALLAKFPFEYDHLLGSKPAPAVRIVGWQPPAGGVVVMLLGVFLVMGLILIATLFGGKQPTGNAGTYAIQPAA